MAAPDLYERVAMSLDAIPLVRLGVNLRPAALQASTDHRGHERMGLFGVLVAIGLYLTYVDWLVKPASPSAKNNP